MITEIDTISVSLGNNIILYFLSIMYSEMVEIHFTYSIQTSEYYFLKGDIYFHFPAGINGFHVVPVEYTRIPRKFSKLEPWRKWYELSFIILNFRVLTEENQNSQIFFSLIVKTNAFKIITTKHLIYTHQGFFSII